MRNIIAALLSMQLLFGATTAVAEQPVDPEKRALIMELMEITGAKNFSVQFSEAITGEYFKAIKAVRPDFPDRALTIIYEEIFNVLEADIDSFMEDTVPIYDRHFNLSELRDLREFYRTPTGQKTISTLPRIMQESMAAGQAWAGRLTPILQQRIRARLKQEGLN
ncbi:MAG: DUF2059 domain-containing protein [Alphaproteobacteria bacterium]|nr:DUF2059 domain-containing protein [Alphaproteobacteria bacterium]